MPDAALGIRIDRHRAALALLLRQRIAVNLRLTYPDLRALWVADYDGVHVARALGKGRTILWDRDRNRDEAFHGRARTEAGTWWLTDDLLLLVACLPVDTPRAKDGYVIVRLPDAEADDA